MFKSNKISSQQIQKIIKCFVEDIPATKVAAIFDLNRKTVDKYYVFLRNFIVEQSLKEALLAGLEKVVAFSLPKVLLGEEHILEHKKIFALTIQEKNKKIFLISQGLLLKKDIQPIIKKEEVTKNFLFFKEWQSYSAVILDGYTFYNIHHVSNKTQKKITLSHLFWIYAKRRFVIYNGVAKHMYGTFIKNSEYRFNHRYEDLYLLIMRLLKEQGHVLPQD